MIYSILWGGLRGNVERVANMFVDVIARLIDTYGKENIPPKSATTRLADLIWQMRPLADIAIDASCPCYGKSDC